MKSCFSQCVDEHIKKKEKIQRVLRHIEFGPANRILQNLRILQILIQSEKEKDLFEVLLL